MASKRSHTRPRRGSMGEVYGETPRIASSGGINVDESLDFDIGLEDISFSANVPTAFAGSSPPIVAASPSFSPRLTLRRGNTSSAKTLHSFSSAKTMMSSGGPEDFKRASEMDKRMSLTASATSKIQTSQFLERKKTVGNVNARLASTSNYDDDEAMQMNMDDFSDFYDASAFLPSVQETSFQVSVPTTTTTQATATRKKYYIHLRHVTPAVMDVKHSLKSTFWSDTGAKLGKTLLTSCREQGCPNQECMFHLMGQIDLPEPLNVGYIQLKKTFKVIPLAEVFIQDICIKTDVKLAPDTGVLAYFRFSGYILDVSARVVIRNLLATQVSHQTHLQVLAKIANSKKNKGKFIQDRLLPPLEWADTTVRPKLFVAQPGVRTKTTFIVTAMGKKIQYDNFSNEETRPHLANQALNMLFNPNYFQGAPGFGEMPPKHTAFSGIKFEHFLRSNEALDTMAFAKSQVPKNNPLAINYVDFTPFMQENMTCNPHLREILETKHMMANHDTDEEFSRQFLESLFCTQMQALRTAESRNAAPFKSSAASGLLGHIRQRSFDSDKWVIDLATECKLDIETKRVFFVDYSKLVGIPRNRAENGYFAPARCIFQLDDRGVLMPKAIALFYEDEQQWKTHLPSHASWKVAKLFLKCAAGQEHQIVSHALLTHLCVEPFAIALERKVPLHHFLYRLLKPHFRYTLDLNFKAKTLLLNENGRWDYIGATGGPDAGHLQFLLKHFREWSCEQMCLPDDLRRRGFESDPRLADFELPGYMYAKDGIAMWDFIHAWVEGLVYETYQCEQDFLDDEVSRDYFTEVETEGFPNNPAFHPSTRVELIKVLSGLVFTSSVTHAAVNFPQFAQYGYVANSPMILSKPAPQPDEPCAIDPYLPNEAQCLIAMRAVWGLSRFTLDDERFMLAMEVQHFYNLALWNDPRYRPHCEAFTQKMAALESYILKRPPTIYGTKYLWLLPSTIPTAITT